MVEYHQDQDMADREALIRNLRETLNREWKEHAWDIDHMEQEVTKPSSVRLRPWRPPATVSSHGAGFDPGQLP